MSIARVRASWSLCSLLFLGAASAAGGPAALRSDTVSPGELDRSVDMGTGCFTFSWSAVEGARGFELAVYGVDAGATDVEAKAGLALTVRVPATSAWTPSLEKCLRPGRYAWVVRAQSAAGWSEWSLPRLFAVRGDAPVGVSSAGPRPERPATAASLDWRSLAIPEPRAAAGEPRFTPAPQRPRPLANAAFSPPSCSGSIFSDVTGANPNCAWIEQLAADEIAQPCEDGPPGARRYCPDHPVTRGQIAGLLERAMRGTDAWRAEQGDGVVPNLPPAAPSSQSYDVPGWFSSITIGADGLGLISFYDAGWAFLRVAHCSNVPCTEATTSPVDSTSGVGHYSSITIGADGLGLISYYDTGGEDLRVAHCADLGCTTADEITPLDTTDNVGQHTSTTIGADGLGLISYYDATQHDLKVAHCSDVKCTAATITAVDTVDDVGQFTSITIGEDGLGLISYYDATNGHLKVAHCSDIDCTAATKTAIDVSEYNVGKNTSITVGADGRGLISYYDVSNSDLRVAHCSDVVCTAATATRIDGFPGVMGRETSITIGADGLGLVSHWDSEFGDLRVAHCSNTNCTSARVAVVDSADFVGQYPSITIGADGLGLISYYDETNFDLKVAHCPNVLCAPYFRRR